LVRGIIEMLSPSRDEYPRALGIVPPAFDWPLHAANFRHRSLREPIPCLPPTIGGAPNGCGTDSRRSPAATAQKVSCNPSDSSVATPARAFPGPRLPHPVDGGGFANKGQRLDLE